MSRSYYTNVVLFAYKTQDGPVWKSKQKNSETAKANVNVEISTSHTSKQVGIAKAKAVHYITSKSDGEGVVYGYKAIVKSKGSSY